MNILVTPDFGRSDAWDFSFATKFLLGQFLHEGQLPLWSRLLGGGFPLIGEGQIGAFFLPNMIAFGLLPQAVAYSATLLFALITAALGMYVFARRLKFDRLIALFVGLSFALSGIFIPQLTHHTLIQGLSLLPWVMVATTMLVEKLTVRRVALWAILVSQQIFTGFPQVVFVTILVAVAWTVWHKKYFILLAPFVLAVALGAIQLLPSYEFLTQSTVEAGFSPLDATYFSYPPVHLTTLLWPYLLGNPREGTYPHFSQFDGSIFWENTGYFGTLGLLLALVGLVHALLTQQRAPKFFLLSAMGALLLMLGKHSPLYIIFSFWPFSLFRVPSRFLWVFVFSLVVLAGYALNTLAQNKSLLVRGVVLLLVVMHVAQLALTWRGYHAWGDIEEWMKPPPLVLAIPKNARVSSIGTGLVHNRSFLTQGWQDLAPFFHFRGALAADGNVIWDVASVDVYAGRQLRRQGIFSSLLAGEISTSEHEATINATGVRLLEVQGASHIITAVPFTAPSPLEAIARDGDITLYELTKQSHRVYIATDIKRAQTVADAQTVLLHDDFQPGASVLLAANDAKDIQRPGEGSARIASDEDTRVIIDVEMKEEGVLVVADTYYPGWQAWIDGTPTSIIPANIYQRAVVVPRGTHRVTFLYRSKSFELGAGIFLVGLLVTVSLVVFPPRASHVRISQTAPLPDPRRRHNPYRSQTHKA